MSKLTVDSQSSEEELAEVVREARQHRRDIDAVHGQAHVHNHIPRAVRLNHLILSTVLILYGSFGISRNDVVLPTKRGGGIHFHDLPAWLMFGAMVLAAATMLSVILDHYDKRDNERKYRRFALGSEITAWLLAIAATVLHVMRL